MGRMNEEEVFQEDTPPNVIISDEDMVPTNHDGPRSDSPIIQFNEKTPDIPDKETNVALQTVPCSKCDR